MASLHLRQRVDQGFRVLYVEAVAAFVGDHAAASASGEQSVAEIGPSGGHHGGGLSRGNWLAGVRIRQREDGERGGEQELVHVNSTEW